MDFRKVNLKTLKKTVSGQFTPLTPRKTAPRLVLGFGSRSELVLVLGGNQTITPKKNCPQVRVRFWFKISGWGQCSSGSISLELKKKHSLRNKHIDR